VIVFISKYIFKNLIEPYIGWLSGKVCHDITTFIECPAGILAFFNPVSQWYRQWPENINCVIFVWDSVFIFSREL
jgi:hypothetical protein